MATLYVRIRGRTQGPFELEKLRALVRSGQLARFHEVSENKLNWRKASDFPELFETAAIQGVNQGVGINPTGFSPVSAVPRQAASAAISPAGNGAADSVDARQWHYAVGSTTYGPVDTRTLKELIQSAALGHDDQVWHDGMSNWEVWQSVPELAALSSALPGSTPRRSGASGNFLLRHAKPIAIGASLAVLVLLAGAGFLRRSRPDAMPPEPTKAKQQPNQIADDESGPINSIAQVNSIRSAVGKVVVGWEVLFADGRKFQFPRTMGSAFAVSEDGFMLTNKHVIEEFDNLSRAEETHAENVYMESSQPLEYFVAKCKQPLPEEDRKNFNDLIKSLRELIPKQIQKATPKLWVFVMAEQHDAVVVDVHGSADLAVLKLEHHFPKTFRLLAASPEPLLDAEVRAVGFPRTAMIAFSQEEQAREEIQTKINAQDIVDLLVRFEYGKSSSNIETSFEPRHLQYVLTDGRVSQVSNDTATGLHWLQHSADISGGNSGGPLVDSRGIVLGINTTVVINEAASLYRAFCLGQADVRSFINKNVNGKVIWVEDLP